MQTLTKRISDSLITTACDSLGARAVFEKMALAVMPSAAPEQKKIVQVDDAAAVCAVAADAPIVKAAERMARAVASSKEAPGAAPADALMRAVERMGGHAGQ